MPRKVTLINLEFICWVHAVQHIDLQHACAILKSNDPALKKSQQIDGTRINASGVGQNALQMYLNTVWCPTMNSKYLAKLLFVSLNSILHILELFLPY